MTRMAICMAALMAASALPAGPQQSVPPPPRPAGSGPTLEATMAFIKEKLSDIGKVNFVEFIHNSTNNTDFQSNWTEEVSNVQVDVSSCKVSYHWTVTRNSAVIVNMDSWYSLRDVENIVVKPMEQYQSEVDASSGSPNLVTTAVNPAVSALLVNRPHNVVNFVPFMDASLADRMAKALTHGVEVCGGGNKEPF